MRVIIMFIVIIIILYIHGARGGCNDYTVSAGSTLFQSSKTTNKVLRIGALGTFEAIPTSVPLLNFAVNVINNRSDILPDVLIELHVAYCNRSSSNALLASQTLIDAYNVSALIGALYSFETRISQLVSRIYQIPQIAATPLSTLLSNKIEYPYLVRVIPPDQYEAQSIADLFRIYNWKQAMVYYCDDEFGTYGLSNMVTYTKALNVTLYSNLVTSGAKNFTSNIATVKQLVTLHNIKIFVIYTQAAEAAILLEQMRAEGMVGGEFIYIHTFASALPYLMTKSTPIPSFVGSVVTTPRGAIPGDLYNQFTSLYKKYGTPVPNSQEDPGAAWYYVDAVFLIAVAVDKLISSGKDLEHITGKELLQEIVSSDFTGVTGRILFDDTYDRVGDYVWLEITETGLNLTDIRAIYSPITKSTTFITNLTWNGNNIDPSDGLCYCLNGKCVNEVCVCNKDYSGDFCEKYVGGSGLSRVGLILVIVIPVLIVAAIIAFAVRYNYYKRNKMIKDISGRQRSVLKRSDITLKDRIGRGASGEVFRGMLRGTEVAVKKIVTTTSQEVASDFELECAIMAGLRHPNIVLFMGSCFVPDQNEMLLVMELMERGSLHDIIHNPKIQITREMLLHVAYQAAKGMNFLHQSSPPIIHRDLKSHNILMDDKWNARISDFGITKIKSLSTKKSKEDIKQKTQSLGTIYWTAPEVFEGYPHMEASDCYSFAIVLWEMLHRQTPYGGKEPMSVAVEVVTGVRPRVDANVDKDVKDLMVECWAPVPEQRPNFETIANRLKAMMSVQGLTNPMHNNHQNQIEAPTGSAYFVFTEIDGASDLWDEIPMVMLKSIEMHNKFIRSGMEKYSGYEVEFCQNGFFVAFSKLQYAMNFCLSVQAGLLNLDWPADLLNHPNGKTIINGGVPVWAGLRVRMGLHSGVSNCEVDRATGRVVYFGPLIERTKKLLGATRINYPIVATSIIIDQCNQKGLKFVEDIIYTNCGETMNTARSKMEAIYKIFPKSLVNRDNTSTSSLPHSTVMIEDVNDDGKDLSNDIPMTSRSYKTKEKAKWDISHDALEEKEKVGRGSTGDFIHCMWNGMEVASKVLLNQKVEEDDLLVLKARASVLSKLKHKNLLDFYGVCLDPGHIAVIVGYQPNSGLPSLIATSILTLKQKVKIARQIAEAMDYLVSSEHEWLVTFALKSPNVLVTKDKMEVKLCDFGQGNLRDLARTMTSVGTVAWTAPEILEGDESGPSNKSTVYSFAIIMWEIMAQKVPYYDQHPIKVVNKILGGYRPPCPDDCPDSYRELMEQCWNADPNLRPNWSNILHQLDSIQT